MVVKKMAVFTPVCANRAPRSFAVEDNWDSGGAESAARIVAAVAFAGLPPFLATNDFQGNALPTDDTTSTAALVTLTEGVYTVVVSDVAGGGGEVLIDVTIVE